MMPKYGRPGAARSAIYLRVGDGAEGSTWWRVNVGRHANRGAPQVARQAHRVDDAPQVQLRASRRAPGRAARANRGDPWRCGSGEMSFAIEGADGRIVGGEEASPVSSAP